jgi:hypothetical protein
VLFHGTRQAPLILEQGILRCPYFDSQVSLTRSAEFAACYAFPDRDNSIGAPAIIVLDRRSLRCRYRVEPVRSEWDPLRDEAEESIFGRDVHDLHRHLVGVVWAEEGDGDHVERDFLATCGALAQ